MDNFPTTSSTVNNNQSYDQLTNNPKEPNIQFRNKDKEKSKTSHGNNLEYGDDNDDDDDDDDYDEFHDAEEDINSKNEQAEAVTNFGKDSNYQHGSTSQNNSNPPNMDNDMINSSSALKNFGKGIWNIAGKARSAAKNFINVSGDKDDVYDEDDYKYVKIKFHVHLPISIQYIEEPVIVGNIKKLGNWKEPKVKLI